MPFLSRDLLPAFIGTALAETILRDPQAFEESLAAVSDEITTITGVAAPADGQEPEPWMKKAAAFMILWDRVGSIQGVAADRLKWAEAKYQDVMKMLDQRRVSTAEGRTVQSQTGTIEGMASW